MGRAEACVCCSCVHSKRGLGSVGREGMGVGCIKQVISAAATQGPRPSTVPKAYGVWALTVAGRECCRTPHAVAQCHAAQWGRSWAPLSGLGTRSEAGRRQGGGEAARHASRLLGCVPR